MATKAELEAAFTRFVNNEAKVNSFVNGAADVTIETDAGDLPTMAGIVAGMEIPVFAGADAAAARDDANATLAASGRVFLNVPGDYVEVTTSDQ